MNERDLYESMINLNPSNDKLGRERDLKDNVMQCINHIMDRIESIERKLNETTE